MPRHSLRVARALQADLEGPTFKQRAVTVDFSSGGFAAILGAAPSRVDVLSCVLRLPGQEPLKGQVKVVDLRPLEGSMRVAFAFQALSEGDRERLEQLVFDTVLEQITQR
jgi:c-di-GMP-binding flagellar brake protein YcgR